MHLCCSRQSVLLLLSYLVSDVYVSSCLHQQFDRVREPVPRHLMQRSVAVLKQIGHSIPITNY